jgi:biotin transport system substrate-specific component
MLALAALPIAVLALAIASQIAVPLPFSPVPLTLQSLAVLLIGALLGPWRGAAAVAIWLLLAALGLPLLAQGGSGLGGPTTGYLLAMPAAAALAGWRSSTTLADHQAGSFSGSAGIWLAAALRVR